jgi:RimK family alpha-L-glutamate ligase
MAQRIVIFTDEPGWHGRQLKSAFSARGWQSAYVSLMDCRMDLSLTGHGIIIPGCKTLPDGAFVRGVPGGSLEQVVLRLDILHALRELGVPVYNDARAIERSVDKAMTSFLLKKAGLPSLPTWACEAETQARQIVMKECGSGRELVIKPLFGSQGVGLKRVSSVADLPQASEYNNVFYLQRFVNQGEGNWHDWRIFVVGGEAVTAMIRRGTSWINNVAQGACCEAAQLDPELVHLAEAASQALGMEYTGVDIIRDADGRRFVVEVNGIPAWQGLQKVCRFNIARRLADDFIGRHLARRARIAG